MNFIFWQMSLFLPRLLCILEHWLWSNLKEGTWNIWWIEIMLVRLVKLAFRGKKTRWKIVRKEASHTWNLFYLLCQEKRRKGKKRKGKGKKKRERAVIYLSSLYRGVILFLWWLSLVNSLEILTYFIIYSSRVIYEVIGFFFR